MTDAVARDYIGRPDDKRTDELLFRDYVEADNPRLTDAQRKARAPTTPWGTVVANVGVAAGAVGLAAFATSRLLDGSIVINGEPLTMTFGTTLRLAGPVFIVVLFVFVLMARGLPGGFGR